MLDDQHHQLKQRFNTFRKVMGWTWKNIETMTGRKHARTNISKRIPAWAMLGIHAHERYQVQLFIHLIQVFKYALGPSWIMTPLSHQSMLYLSSENTKLWIEVGCGEDKIWARSNSTTLWGQKSLLITLYNMELYDTWHEAETESLAYQWSLQPHFDEDLQKKLKNIAKN